MRTMNMTASRQWTRMLGLGLALAIVAVAVLAVALPAAALALTVALILAGAALLGERARAVGRRAHRPAAGTTEGTAAQPSLQIELADGALLSARPVALPGEGERTMVLTRDGYLLLSAEGRVVHRI